MSTIRDVAREAGVSEGTVSNVFNDRPHVTEKMRERVLAAAKLVGYRRNALAQALRLGERRVLGLCLRDISNPTFGSIVLGIEAVARQRSYQVILGNSAGNPKTERAYLEEFMGHQVAGIITAPVLEDPQLYQSIDEAGIPLVFINERPGNVRGDLVKHDYASGTRQATEHLLGLGHREIAIVYGPEFASPGMEQRDAFHATMAASHLEARPDLEVFATFGIDGAYRAALGLLTRPSPPSALIGSTLAITLGCLRAIAETGIEVEFVGTGDETWLRMFPHLTIVRQQSEAVGRNAVACLMDRLDMPAHKAEDRQIILPVQLIPHARQEES